MRMRYEQKERFYCISRFFVKDMNDKRINNEYDTLFDFLDRFYRFYDLHNKSNMLNVFTLLYKSENKFKLNQIAIQLSMDEKTLYYFRKTINDFALNVILINYDNKYSLLSNEIKKNNIIK